MNKTQKDLLANVHSSGCWLLPTQRTVFSFPTCRGQEFSSKGPEERRKLTNPAALPYSGDITGAIEPPSCPLLLSLEVTRLLLLTLLTFLHFYQMRTRTSSGGLLRTKQK